MSQFYVSSNQRLLCVYEQSVWATQPTNVVAIDYILHAVDDTLSHNASASTFVDKCSRFVVVKMSLYESLFVEYNK